MWIQVLLTSSRKLSFHQAFCPTYYLIRTILRHLDSLKITHDALGQGIRISKRERAGFVGAAWKHSNFDLDWNKSLSPLNIQAVGSFNTYQLWSTLKRSFSLVCTAAALLSYISTLIYGKVISLSDPCIRRSALAYDMVDPHRWNVLLPFAHFSTSII